MTRLLSACLSGPLPLCSRQRGLQPVHIRHAPPGLRLLRAPRLCERSDGCRLLAHRARVCGRLVRPLRWGPECCQGWALDWERGCWGVPAAGSGIAAGAAEACVCCKRCCMPLSSFTRKVYSDMHRPICSSIPLLHHPAPPRPAWPALQCASSHSTAGTAGRYTTPSACSACLRCASAATAPTSSQVGACALAGGKLAKGGRDACG
jgi:hypothetical protein